MKKRLFMLSACLLLFLSGCSLLNDAKNSLTYINEATDYLNKATAFANDVPSLAQQAVTNPQSAEQLGTMLQDMKQEITSFNKLQAPDIAADFHQQIVEQNNKFISGIDVYLAHIKNGRLDPAVLENTEMFQTVQEITSIVDQIKQLGQ
jgi:hypothetical protein